MKSSGNLPIFRLICSLRRLVGTPYRSARSESSSAFRPLTRRILPSMRSSGMMSAMMSSFPRGKIAPPARVRKRPRPVFSSATAAPLPRMSHHEVVVGKTGGYGGKRSEDARGVKPELPINYYNYTLGRVMPSPSSSFRVFRGISSKVF